MSRNVKGSLLKKLPLPSSPPELPVVKPSEQEFEDLEALLRSQGHLGAQHGAIKVVPPLGYKARETYEGYDTLLRCCASQTAVGDHGLYELQLEEAGSMYLSDLEGIVAETEKEGEVQWSSDVKTAEIEFWRNIGLGDSSTVYTAQSVNSTLFDKSTRPWNLHAMRQQVALHPMRTACARFPGASLPERLPRASLPRVPKRMRVVPEGAHARARQGHGWHAKWHACVRPCSMSPCRNA